MNPAARIATGSSMLRPSTRIALRIRPATAAQVNEYAAWYDRHHDPEWADILLTPPDVSGQRRPVAFETPRTVEDIRRLGKAISTVAFKSAGNLTHTPGYGSLIALGIRWTATAP